MKKKNKQVEIELDLEDELILTLALEAHKYHVTLNEYINMVLRAFVGVKEEKDESTNGHREVNRKTSKGTSKRNNRKVG